MDKGLIGCRMELQGLNMYYVQSVQITYLMELLFFSGKPHINRFINYKLSIINFPL